MGEGIVGLVEDVEGLEAEVELDVLRIEGECLMQAQVELMEVVEADRVASRVAIGMIDVGKGENRAVQSEQVLIASDLEPHRSRQDRIAGQLVGALDEQGADLLKAVGGIGDVHRQTAAGTVDGRQLPAAERLLHEVVRVVAPVATSAIRKIVDDGKNVVQGLVVG